MTCFRLFRLSAASIALTLTLVHAGWPQGPSRADRSVAQFPTAKTCKVYSLSDLGDDPKLCKWLADTIPAMIQPASWKESDARLSYFAPSKILVVNNTPAVHAQLEEFLGNLRKAMPQQQSAKGNRDAQVVQAQFNAPAPPMPPPYPNAYPVPPPPALPKHLFHFIIRYEGEGIIDQNVVKFAKALTGEKKSEATRSEIVPAPPPSTPIVQSGNSGITPMGSPLVPSPEMSSAGSPNVPRLPPANVAPQVGEPSPPPPPPLPF